MIYRHLRELEENGLVSSECETEGAGPAKRVSQLSMEGREALELWIGYMQNQAERLLKFVGFYQEMNQTDD